MAVDIRKENSMRKSDTSVAKMRWNLLAKALHEGRVHQNLRRFSNFGLIHMTRLYGSEYEDPKGHWYECRCIEDSSLKLQIRLLSDKITVEELQGFDNTGNVCIWPSEEVLAYYCMKNKEIFGGRSVCELGGGMTCLSGLVVAATAGAKEVFITDGNNKSIQNVSLIIERNLQCFGITQVVSRMLRWDSEIDLIDLRSRFDVILCADCLYFDEARQPLTNTIWKIMKDNGLAVILAPPRGRTFQQFVDLAQQRFYIERLMAYDTYVWELHVKLKETQSDIYDDNLHYPQMLILRKM